MSNERILRLHAFIRNMLAATQRAYSNKGPQFSIVNAYPMSVLRPDLTRGHVDMVHYCPEFDRELTQLLLHTMCSCSHEGVGMTERA